MKFAVVYGSVRSERTGIRVAHFIVAKLKDMGHEVTLIDPIDYKLPLLENRYSDYVKAGNVPEVVEKVAGIFNEADGFVFVTGEYNHMPPPALINIIDHFYKDQFGRKVAGIASYSAGGFGGARAAILLRPMLGEVGLVTIPRIFSVPLIASAFGDHETVIDKSYDEKVKGFVEELEWYTKALKDARNS